MVSKPQRFSPYQKSSVVRDHPHTQQLCPSKHVSIFDEVLIHGKFPRQRYQPKKDAMIESTIHRGQRKLLMSEIGALIKLNPEHRCLVVYAGAAPGIHIPLLSSLFPQLCFHLYDPARFAITETESIKIFNKHFTDEIAEYYYENKDPSMQLVFICDIRRTIKESMIWEDMLAQQKWHEIMQPCLTSLKFRLPWPGCGVVDESNQVSYLDGEIHLPIWGPRNTTESRLVIEKDRHSGLKLYDCLAYEEEMCFFNRRIRPSIHNWHYRRDNGLDGCYDCTAETKLIEKYNKQYKHIILTSSLISMVLKRKL